MPVDDVVAAEALELFGDRSRRAMHVVEQLRVGVEVVPPSGDLGVQVGDAVDDWHRLDPHSAPVQARRTV